MKEPEVQVYAWGAAGMRNATQSKRHPDDGFVKVADYRVMVRMWRKAEEDKASANRIMARRERCDGPLFDAGVNLLTGRMSDTSLVVRGHEEGTGVAGHPRGGRGDDSADTAHADGGGTQPVDAGRPRC